MIPGLFPGQWGGESRQQSHQSPQHQPSHLNAFQMQQQMMMRHQQQHGGQSQVTIPPAGAQLVSHHGHSTLDNSATAQAQAAMIMNHQSMSNPLAQVSVSGGGGVATSVGGGGSLNGIPNAASFARMLQQFQQQAGGGGLTQQGSQLQLGQMNPVMCGNTAGGTGACGGVGFNAQSHHHHQQQQAQVPLYWNALQASSIGSQHHGQQEAGQAQQLGMEPSPRTKSAVSVMNSHHQQQVGVPAQQQQQQTNQGLVHNQQQPQLLGSGGDAAAQLQDPQTQLLLQQQNLIAQLQLQLQQQQQRGQQQPQPGNNAGSMSQNQLLPGQLQQWQGMPVTGGGGQQLISSSNNAIHQSQQLGNMSFSSSIGGGQSQNPSQTTSNNPDRLQFPTAIQELMERNGNASVGSQMGQQNNLERSMQAQHQQLRHQAHQMAKFFVKDSNIMSGALSSQKCDQFHEVLGNNSQHSISHQSSGTASIPNATLMEPMISSDNQARTGSTKPSRGSTPVPPTAPSRAPSAAGSVWGDDVSAAMQKQNWNQQVLLEAMARRVSVASTGTQQQCNATNAQAAQAQAQDPQQKQQQLLMTHLLQQQLGRGGVNSSASSARNLVPTISTLGVDGGGGVTGLGGGLSRSSAVGASDEAAGQNIMLEQRVKQYQVMQHLKQLQHQKVDNGGVDSVVGGNHQQSQAQQKLAQFQSQQAQQQHYLCHDQGLPTVVVVSGLAQGRNNKQVKNSASTSAPTASGDSTAASLPNELLSFSCNVGNKSSSPRRGSLGSLSQGSLSQGSLSQGSYGIVDLDPIADGFNTALGCAALVGSTAAGGEGSGGRNGQQKFLDGHFEGGWQSNADLPDRRRINFHIIKVIERMRPDANRMSQK